MRLQQLCILLMIEAESENEDLDEDAIQSVDEQQMESTINKIAEAGPSTSSSVFESQGYACQLLLDALAHCVL